MGLVLLLINFQKIPFITSLLLIVFYVCEYSNDQIAVLTSYVTNAGQYDGNYHLSLCVAMTITVGCNSVRFDCQETILSVHSGALQTSVSLLAHPINGIS